VPIAIVGIFASKRVVDEVGTDSEMYVFKFDVRATYASVEDENANDAPETVRRISRKEFFIER
jgi:hypothetical protein